MSLEKKIEELTEAVTALTVAMEGGATAAPKTEKKEEKKKAPAKGKGKAKAKKEDPVEEEAEDENIHDKKYYTGTVQPTTRKAAKALGRDAVMGILDEFGTGLETAKDLEEGQWKEYVARLEAEMSEADDEDDMA